MDNMEMILELSNMAVGEHKQMSKVLRLIMSVGIDQFTALSIILPAMRLKRVNKKNDKNVNVVPARR